MAKTGVSNVSDHCSALSSHLFQLPLVWSEDHRPASVIVAASTMFFVDDVLFVAVLDEVSLIPIVIILTWL